jgi:hypothetical protein
MSNMSKEKSESIDRLLLILIIACCFPFVLVESQSFKDFVACLNPDYKLPCRKKVRSLLSELYREKIDILFLKTQTSLVSVWDLPTLMDGIKQII